MACPRLPSERFLCSKVSNIPTLLSKKPNSQAERGDLHSYFALLGLRIRGIRPEEVFTEGEEGVELRLSQEFRLLDHQGNRLLPRPQSYAQRP